MAINRFMFPRIELSYDIDTECFDNELGNEEIQYLAVFMKNEWYSNLKLKNQLFFLQTRMELKRK